MPGDSVLYHSLTVIGVEQTGQASNHQFEVTAAATTESTTPTQKDRQK
jgi:hypothetical protein